MNPEFWLERWQNNQIGFHQDEVNVHLESHWDGLGAKPGCSVFVPLCGKSLDMTWLASRGHPVVGNEISELAVKAFFEEAGLVPEVADEGRFKRYSADLITLLCGDFFDLRPEDVAECTAVYDRASLIALPKDMRPAYAEHIKRLLPKTPHLLVTLSYDQSQMNGPPFSVHEEEVRAYYEPDYQVDKGQSVELIEEEPRFKQRGLDSLLETVYRLV